MRSPLSKLEITTPGGVRQDFKAHSSRKYPGIDLVTYPNYVQPIYAIEDGYAIPAHDGVDPYMQLNGKTGSWIYAHLTSTTPARQVKEGEIIGYTGRDHLHLGLIQNGVYVDPEPYLKQFLANPTNSTVNNQNMQVIANTSQYPGLSLIARDVYKMSDWDTEAAWLRVLDINPHLKTGNLNIIPANQPIYAQSTVSQITENNEELKKLQAELEAKKQELDNTAKDFQTKLSELEAKQKEEVLKIVTQSEVNISKFQAEIAEIKEKEQKATMELLNLKQEVQNAFNVDFPIEQIHEVVKRTRLIDRVVKGWGHIIDRFTAKCGRSRFRVVRLLDSDVVRGALKYNSVVVVLWGAFYVAGHISILLLELEWNAQDEASVVEIMTIISGLLGFTAKDLLPNYDTNGDKVINLEDLKSF